MADEAITKRSIIWVTEAKEWLHLFLEIHRILEQLKEQQVTFYIII